MIYEINLFIKISLSKIIHFYYLFDKTKHSKKKEFVAVDHDQLETNLKGYSFGVTTIREIGAVKFPSNGTTIVCLIYFND